MLRALFSVSLSLISTFTVAQSSSTAPKSTPEAANLSTSTPAPDSRSLMFRTIVPINYPQAAQDAGTQGRVVVRMTVNESGDVESAGIVSGAPILASAATEAIKEWKFQPYIQDGKPVRVSTNLPFLFAIADGKCTNGVKQATVTTPFEDAVTVAEKDMQGYVCNKVPAAYPRMAELARISGDVVMALKIGKDGTVQNLHVLSSASPLLNQSALDAARQWRYRPYLVSDKPVPVETTITIAFR
jgi:TonB family protein